MTTPTLGHCVGTVLGAVALAFASGPAAWADTVSRHAWISTWTASPQPTWGEDFAFPTNVPATLQDRTIRQIARVSLGGRRLRLVISNEYGSRPLALAAVHVGVAGQGSDIVAGSNRSVTFSGLHDVIVPPGAPMVSDPVDLEVVPLSRISVSVYLRDNVDATTFHWDARQTTYIAEGNQASATRIETGSTTTARLFLGGIQVEAEAGAQAVLVMGDSITDGNGATMDADTRWPDFLATRLAPHRIAVLNAGISGARLLGDRMGANALARFDRDVLSQPRVKAVILLLGINDISWPGTAFDRDGVRPALDRLVAGYRQLIARAHARGLRIVGATLTPFEGALPGTPLADYYQESKDTLRGQVNAWVRTSGEFDAVVDFDALLRGPEHPTRLRVEFDSGDHLHPGDEGNRAMAAAISPDVLLGPGVVPPLDTH